VNAAEILRANINRLMRDAGLDQQGFAQKVGRSRSWATTFLKARTGTTLGQVDRIAAAFEVRPRDLFDESLVDRKETAGIVQDSEPETQPVTAGASTAAAALEGQQEAPGVMGFDNGFVREVAGLAQRAVEEGFKDELDAVLTAFRATRLKGGTAHPAPGRGLRRGR